HLPPSFAGCPGKSSCALGGWHRSEPDWHFRRSRSTYRYARCVIPRSPAATDHGSLDNHGGVGRGCGVGRPLGGTWGSVVEFTERNTPPPAVPAKANPLESIATVQIFPFGGSNPVLTSVQKS